MITNAERDHVKKLKQWAQDTRRAFKNLRDGPVGRLLQKLKPEVQPDEALFDNLDWLIRIIEREANLQSKRILQGKEVK
jgi:hypothetical protein